MEIEVLWAEQGDRPAFEDHLMAERGFDSEVVSDVVNVKFERDDVYPQYKEQYPKLSLVHSDGSVTRGRGRFKSVSGEMATVKSVEYQSRNNELISRHYRNCFGVWWECSRDEFGTLRKPISLLYWDEDDKTVHIDQIQPEYASVNYPDGTTITEGEHPLDEVSFAADHTSKTMTLTVTDREGEQRVIRDVNSVATNKFGHEGRVFKVHRSDGVVETVADIVDIDGPNYLLQEVVLNGPYTEIRTRFGALSVMDSIENDDLGEGDLYSVYINDSISPNASVTRQNLEPTFRDSKEVFVVSPDGVRNRFE